MTADRLTVAFDVTPVISGRTGIARYVTSLGEALERQGLALFRFAVGRSSFPVPLGTRRLPLPARIVSRLWSTLSWPPAESIAGAASVVHATGMLVPPTKRPLVVTVHDLAGLRHPELHPPRHVEQQRALLPQLSRADVVITVSQATADDLAALGVAAKRIVVAPLGIRGPATSSASQTSDRPFLLTVGETSARKGYPRLLRALAHVPDLELVMAGPPAADEPKVLRLIEELGLGARVRRLGSVTDDELAALYAEALALCFPSVAEGFGLPVLEAMAAGLPVVASDIPPSRELTDGAAILVPVDDLGGWSDALRDIASKASLRRDLAAAGRARAAEYTWERTARQTTRAYELALSG